MSSFTTPLDLEYLDGRDWKLTTPFLYHVGRLGSGIAILVPAGFHTDFASIPRLFWRILPPTGPYGKAAVLHDYLYRCPIGYSRLEADNLFLEAMAVLGVGVLTRWMLWLAVRLFGASSYQPRHPSAPRGPVA